MKKAMKECELCKPCRVMMLTTNQFMRLGGEQWDHGILIRVGRRASHLHNEIFGKPPKKVRLGVGFRNKVGVYPCGILEQAYRHVIASEGTGAAEEQIAAEGEQSSGTSGSSCAQPADIHPNSSHEPEWVRSTEKRS